MAILRVKRLMVLKRTLFVLGLSLPATALADTGPPLAGSALDRAVSGRRIYLATPLGGEFPMNYYRDGRLDAQGEASGLGRFVKPSDSGRWWVDGSKLCQKWTSWYDGRTFCFVLRPMPDKKLAWERDDGLSGVARIGDERP